MKYFRAALTRRYLEIALKPPRNCVKTTQSFKISIHYYWITEPSILMKFSLFILHIRDKNSSNFTIPSNAARHHRRQHRILALPHRWQPSSPSLSSFAPKYIETRSAPIWTSHSRTAKYSRTTQYPAVGTHRFHRLYSSRTSRSPKKPRTYSTARTHGL